MIIEERYRYILNRQLPGCNPGICPPDEGGNCFYFETLSKAVSFLTPFGMTALFIYLLPANIYNVPNTLYS